VVVHLDDTDAFTRQLSLRVTMHDLAFSNPFKRLKERVNKIWDRLKGKRESQHKDKSKSKSKSKSKDLDERPLLKSDRLRARKQERRNLRSAQVNAKRTVDSEDHASGGVDNQEGRRCSDEA